MKIKIKGCELKFIKQKRRLTEYDTSKMQQVKYNSSGTTLFEGSTDASKCCAYVIPYKIKPGSQVVVAMKSDSNIKGTLHKLRDVNVNILPREILSEELIGYSTVKMNTTSTLSTTDDTHVVALYLWHVGGNVTEDIQLTPEMVAAGLDYIEIEVADDQQ